MTNSGRKNFKYTDEMLTDGSKVAAIITDAILTVAKRLGHRPSHGDLRRHECGVIAGKLSAKQIRNICTPLAVPEPTARVIWTQARCEQAVRKVWKKLNRRPTHQDLRDHRYHRAVGLLSAADIDRVGRDAGLADNRHRKPAGYWTPETVVEAYLERFAHFDFGPRPFELRQMGEGALKAMIERRFGSFHKFEAVIRLRCPTMKFKEKPVTATGIALDSFREVAAYEGIMLHLGVDPVEILIHEKFPNPHVGAYPDFIVRNVVVEVVMYSRENESQRSLAYFKKLRAKVAAYIEAGFEVVEIHPQQVVNAGRRAEVISNIRAKLGTETMHQASGQSMREHGYWSRDSVRAEIAALTAKLGRFPTYRDLDAHNIGSARKGLQQYPRELLAEELGYPVKKQSHGFWTEEKVLKECERLGGGIFPSRSVLDTEKTLLAAMKNSPLKMKDWRRLFKEHLSRRK
ncbi:hypothetical protein [Neorhizobium galegae]|uniref:hypothetical protein n=1 Tax=Neorhizobium galegae TaxID=399 RepID=UPI00062261FC|nr:hypothetical protein [Neorhizobium galegae]CDZ54433.1 Hypothetical protein NGAL_HAMBI2427_56390 [Neorhizobium galegae bv. orientalis]